MEMPLGHMTRGMRVGPMFVPFDGLDCSPVHPEPISHHSCMKFLHLQTTRGLLASFQLSVTSLRMAVSAAAPSPVGEFDGLSSAAWSACFLL